MKKIILIFSCYLALLFTAPVEAKRIELVFWHGMAGHLGDEVQSLADAFNQSQENYFIKPVYKGNYVEILTSFAAAFRAHHPPSIVQVFEVGTEIMSSPKGVIKPVDELMQEQGVHLPKEDFIQSVREFYSKNGQLMALPFNLSVAIMYYNLDILSKVGYAQANFPRTWSEMEVLAEKLKKAGYECTYTTAYPGWVLFESFLAIHGLPITQNNPVRATFATPQLARHFERLKRWHSLHYFRYAGRVDDATILFTSGTCPLFSQSSGAYNSLSALVPFHFGISIMPLDTQASPIRHANVAGGAALWAVAGQTKEEYQGIAQFFAFIVKPETQNQWHQHTGYLPIGLQGVYAGILQTSTHPTLQVARDDLGEVSANKAQRRFGPQNQIREINDEILEAMFAGSMSPSQALQQSIVRTNHVLRRFIRNTDPKL